MTDIARYKNPDEPKDVVKNWMRSSSAIEFLGLWEQLNNPDFKGVEFDSFLHVSGSNDRYIGKLNSETTGRKDREAKISKMFFS